MSFYIALRGYKIIKQTSHVEENWQTDGHNPVLPDGFHENRLKPSQNSAKNG